MDVLENGYRSKYFNFFDVDWDHPASSLNKRILAPFLGRFYGECLDGGEIALRYGPEGFKIVYYGLVFPLRIESYPSLFANLTRLKSELAEDLQIELEMQNEELRRSQEQLEASRARYFDLYDLAPVGYLTLNEHGSILEANLTAVTMLGAPKSLLNKNSFTHCVLREDQDIFYRHRRSLFETGAPQVFEIRMRNSNGTQYWARVEARVAQDGESGAPICRVVLSDITEPKRMEEEIRRSRDELEQRVRERTAELERRNQELQEFTFVASHDLSEPLGKIQTFGSLLGARNAEHLDEQSRGSISRMIGAADRMRDLLDALLRYSRLETKGQEFGPTRLGDVVRDAISDLEVASRKIEARVEIETLPTVMGDPNQLRQLFQNLISNSLKYHRPDVKTVIKVHAGEEDGRCGVLVEDNGIGFDQKYVVKIFQPFQRLYGKHEYPGIGIGLAICKKIVDRHGGTITAKSTPGEGSTFIVTFPAIPDEYLGKE